MADMLIDISGEEDNSFSVENEQLSWIVARSNGLKIEMNFEQTENLYRNLRKFFEDES